MKKLFFISLLMLFTSLAFSQVNISFNNNNTNVYYGATFNTVAVSGTCPSTPATSFYIDIPNNHSGSDFAYKEDGYQTINISDISGISLDAMSGGNGGTYVISFCSGNPGSAIINEPGPTLGFATIVTWYINTGTNTVHILFQ